MAQPVQTAGFYWSGFLCLILAVLKLTVQAHWSWWRVLLPLWTVLGHNLLYVTIGFLSGFISQMTAQQKNQSQSAKGMAVTVTKSRRWFALRCSRITC